MDLTLLNLNMVTKLLHHPPFLRERPLKSKTTFVVKYNLPELEPPEIILWTQNQNRKRLYQKLGDVQAKTKIFSAYGTTEPHMITQAELKDLFRDLVLLKTKAQLFGSRLQQWNLIEKSMKMSFYRKKQSKTAKYFTMDGDLVKCKEVCGLMEEFQLQHPFEQGRLFAHSSKVSLKAVLLHNGSIHFSIHLALAVHMKIQGLLKKWVTNTITGTYVLNWKLFQSWLGLRRLYKILFFLMWIGQPSEWQVMISNDE